jgi:hypothetical protein
MGGKFHPKLNIGKRPIANKYREGKMKRTLKRELKVREIAERETLETIRSARRSVSCLQLRLLVRLNHLRPWVELAGALF